jgi:hypothetical protein
MSAEQPTETTIETLEARKAQDSLLLASIQETNRAFKELEQTERHADAYKRLDDLEAYFKRLIKKTTQQIYYQKVKDDVCAKKREALKEKRETVPPKKPGRPKGNINREPKPPRVLTDEEKEAKREYMRNYLRLRYNKMKEAYNKQQKASQEHSQE